MYAHTVLINNRFHSRGATEPVSRNNTQCTVTIIQSNFEKPIKCPLKLDKMADITQWMFGRLNSQIKKWKKKAAVVSRTEDDSD